MQQRGVIRFFTLKWLKAKNIHAELESVYCPQALAVRTVKTFGRGFQQRRTDLFDDPRSGWPLTNDLGEAIASMPTERPFSLYKVLCRHFPIGKTACLRILHDKLGLKKISFSLGAACSIG
jgi:hypothetical protein